MSKFFLSLVVLVLSAQPLLAHADYTEYFPHCYDKKLTPTELQRALSFTGEATGTVLPSDVIEANDTVAGMCHTISVSNIVSVDPALQGSFWLGTHNPVSIFQDESKKNFCDNYTCLPSRGDFNPTAYTKYSEDITISTSTTITDLSFNNGNVDEPPVEYVLLDKSHFLPLLKSAFQKAGTAFSAAYMPRITIHIYHPNEIVEIMRTYRYSSSFGTSTAMETVQISNPGNRYESFNVYTENLQHGDYIYSPKGYVAEPQYSAIDKGSGAILTNKDLQISFAPFGHWYLSQTPVVSVTSPLNSIQNYWMFTKTGGKIVLAWEKSVYELNDGTMRTLTRNDTSINAEMLFGGTARAGSDSIGTSTPVAPKSQGFFARIWNWIISWF